MLSIFVGEDGIRHENENDINSYEFPKKNSHQRGSFQYIRMEYCSGGDLEDVVRRAVQLDVSTVRSILFQIFFAFYAGREKLSLRHFDVKLLNFFVSNGSCLLSNSQKEEYDKISVNNNNNNNNNLNNENNNNNNENNNNNNDNNNTGDIVRMRVGFGDHVFALPLQTSSLSVVKLADFGTSAVGAAGLGDSVTAQQVRIVKIIMFVNCFVLNDITTYVCIIIVIFIVIDIIIIIVIIIIIIIIIIITIIVIIIIIIIIIIVIIIIIIVIIIIVIIIIVIIII